MEELMHIVQVDERVAPPKGDPDRNLTHLCASLLEQAPLRPEQIYAMPVEDKDLDAAAASYVQTLQEIAGTPPVLDLAHLGLGPDGHTASLVPEDPVCDINDADVAMTGIYQGRRRMTLTYPMPGIAPGRILWLVTGAEKAGMLQYACARATYPFPPAGSGRTRRWCWPTERLAENRGRSLVKTAFIPPVALFVTQVGQVS